MDILNKPSLFWDVKDVDPQKHQKFVIERILQYGDPEDYKWAMEYYGRDSLIEGLLEARGLDKKSLSFWCQFFNLDIQQCTAKSFTQTPSAYWKK